MSSINNASDINGAFATVASPMCSARPSSNALRVRRQQRPSENDEDELMEYVERMRKPTPTPPPYSPSPSTRPRPPMRATIRMLR
jgi:hypothetical protein